MCQCNDQIYSMFAFWIPQLFGQLEPDLFHRSVLEVVRPRRDRRYPVSVPTSVSDPTVGRNILLDQTNNAYSKPASLGDPVLLERLGLMSGITVDDVGK